MKDSDKYMLCAKHVDKMNSGIAMTAGRFDAKCSLDEVIGNLNESKDCRVLYFLLMHHIAKDKENEK